jgi:hypothetical protein
MCIERITRMVNLRNPKLEVAEDSISLMKGTQMNNKMFSDKVRSVIRATSRIDKTTAVESAIKPRYKTKRIINLLAVIITAAGSPLAWATGHGDASGVVGNSHFGGGGFVGGVSRGAPAVYGGGPRTAPAFQGAYFAGRTVDGLGPASRFYYQGAGIPAVTSHRITASGNRPANRIVSTNSSLSSQRDRAALLTRQNTRVANSQAAAQNRQANGTASIAGRNRTLNPRTPTTPNRQSFVKNRASERHDANNWHRDWDRHHAHFHNNRVFVFVNGFWWGLYPWDYYANGDPYDYDNSYPYDYYDDYPYSYYDSSPYNYDQQPAYDSDQYGNSAAISAVQSELAKLGYYRGAVDGVEGDETQAALARYQEEHDLSVTGTLTTATLQSLGLRRTES